MNGEGNCYSSDGSFTGESYSVGSWDFRGLILTMKTSGPLIIHYKSICDALQAVFVPVIFLLLSFLSTISSRWLMLLSGYAKNFLSATGLSSWRRMAKPSKKLLKLNSCRSEGRWLKQRSSVEGRRFTDRLNVKSIPRFVHNNEKEISHNSAQHKNTEDECKSINVNKNGIKYSYTYKALFNMDCLFWEKQTWVSCG